MKKYLTILISAMLILAAFPTAVFAADTTPPQVLSLTIDKHTVKAGDKVTITCTVSDESGIALDPTGNGRTFLYFKNSNLYSDVFYFTKTGTNTYTSSVVIPKTYLDGTYKLSFFVITDTAGNEYSTRSLLDFPDMYFTVSGASSDHQAPVVESLTINAFGVEPGDTVTVTAKVKDETGIGTDMLSHFLYFKNGIFTTDAFLFSEQESGVYTASLKIPAYYPNGTYELSYYSVTDLVGNEYRTEDPMDFEDLYFHLSGASADLKEPVITSFQTDLHHVVYGDQVTITCILEDDSEMSESLLDCYVQLENGDTITGLLPLTKTADGVYQAVLTMTESFPMGKYRLDRFLIRDNSGNEVSSVWLSRYKDVSFTLYGDTIQKSAAASIEVSDETDASGNPIRYYLPDGSRTDYSGIMIYQDQLYYIESGVVNEQYTQVLQSGILGKFKDVDAWAWYYYPLVFVYGYTNETGERLMSGYSNIAFGPGDQLTRDQFAVVLHRLANNPTASGDVSFPDASETGYYINAVRWAKESGVIRGYDNGLFGIADPITREQVATILYRIALSKGCDASLKGKINTFQDAGSVSSFAADAVDWAVSNGILSGKSGGTLIDPQGYAARAECAAFLQRFLHYLALQGK